MNEQDKSSTKRSSALTASWVSQVENLNNRLRASGRTVRVTESSPTNELQATFVPARRSTRATPTAAVVALLNLASAGPVSLGVRWGDDLHVIEIRPRTWRRLVKGASLGLDTREAYEGQPIAYRWTFDGLALLEVSYGDGGCAYTGGLSGAYVSEAGGDWRRLRRSGAEIAIASD